MAKSIKFSEVKKSTKWYSDEQMCELLQHYVGTDHIHIYQVLSRQDQLSYQLSQLLIDKPQHIIPLNVSALTGELEHGNHWVGLYILINNSSNSVVISYINPMGFSINPDVEETIRHTLSPFFGSLVIEQPLLCQGIQEVQQKSNLEFLGNINECGPMLVYIMACRSRAVDPIKIYSYEESISLGLFLRENFDKKEDFDTIYLTLCKKGSDSTTSPANMVHDNNNEGEEKEKIIKAIDNELLININQLPETEKSITELEQQLFLNLLSDTPTHSLNPEQEKQKTLEQIEESYKLALGHYMTNNFVAAEKEFTQVVKPILSKPSRKNLYVPTEEIKEQALDAMYHLGLIYLKGKDYFNYHAKAASIFQYCSKFAKKYGIGDSNDFLNQALDVEDKFLSSLDNIVNEASNSSITEKIIAYKEDLKQLRIKVKEQLIVVGALTVDQITDRAKAIEAINQNCAKFFVNNDHDREQSPSLIQKLISDCHQQLGGIPMGCEYSIISLGSLSGGKITPWSDLEFAILVNDDNHKEYFRNLTKLLHIKVINFSETLLRGIGIEALNNFKTGKEADDWFWDSNIMTSGFSFDGAHPHACKSPFGRQGGYEGKNDFELILTPEQMAAFQKDEKWFASDKHLVQALRNVGLITGSQDLLDSYRYEIEDIKNIEYQTTLRTRSLTILEEDINKFSLKLGDKEEGKLFDVKKDIYRIGDRIVDDLADYYGISAEKGQAGLTAWGMIDKMLAKNILSPEGAQHLKEVLSIATELRLNTYCHNKGQKEKVSTYQPAVKHLSEEQKHQLLIETFYINDTSILHHFYYVMLSVQNLVKKLCNQESREQSELILKSDNLFDDSHYAKGMVHARFLEYDNALEKLEDARTEQPKDPIILEKLFFICNKTGAIERAISIGHEILELIKAEHQDDLTHPEIAAVYNNLGSAYCAKGSYDESKKYYTLALDIDQKIYKNSSNHPDIAMSYNNLGTVCSKKGSYDEAIKYYTQALEILLKIHEDYPYHPDIAMSCNNLGATYANKNSYDKAIKYNKLALEIKRKIYENSPNHPNIAGSYNNLGSDYNKKCNFDKAIEYHNLALEIRQKAYESCPEHPDIACSYNNLGSIYNVRGSYVKAIDYYIKALEIIKKAYESSPNHPDIALSLNNLGTVYSHKGSYGEAIEYHKKALEIRLEAYKSSPDHPDIASSYNNLGTVYNHKGSYDEAIECYKKALGIQQKAYESSPNHPYIAGSYNNLGSAYYDKGDYDKAIEYHYTALGIQQKAYESSPDHPEIAVSYNNLGSAYYAKGDYDKTIECYNKSMEIRDKAYEVSLNHPDIASSYNNLGRAYYAKGDYDKAIECYYKALDIQQNTYKSNPNHPDIAHICNNLGVAYQKKERYDEALECHQKALEIRHKAYEGSPNHPSIADSYNGLGIAYRNKGSYDMAIEHYKQALEIQQKAYEANLCHPNIALGYNNLGVAYCVKGDYDKALGCYHRALKIRLKAYASSPDHPEIAASYNNLGLICSAQKKYAKAVFYLTEAKEIYNKIYESNPNHPDLLKTIGNLGVAIQGNREQIINICSYLRDEGHFSFLLRYLSKNISLTTEQLNEVKEAYTLYKSISFTHTKPSFEECFSLYPYEDNPDFFVDNLSGNDTDAFMGLDILLK